MDEILFTIIMPSYNQGNFIEKAIDSVVNQTYTNWELLIIDNNSNDNTNEVLLKFTDQRIKIYKVNNYGIISYSRNIGLRTANGTWITFLDTDDFWYFNRLEEILKLIKTNPSLEIISHDEYVTEYKTNLKKIQRYGSNSPDLYKSMLLYGNIFSTSSIAIKKCFIDNLNLKFDESREFVTAEDYELWLSLIYHNPKIYFSKVITGEYTIHKNNNSKNFIKHFSAIEAVLKKHIFKIQNFDINKKRLLKNIIISLNTKLSFYYFKNGFYVFAIKLILKNIYTNPIQFFKVVKYNFK